MFHKLFFNRVVLILFVCLFTQTAFSVIEGTSELVSGGQIDTRFYSPNVYPPGSTLPLVFQNDGKIVAAGRLSPDTFGSSKVKLYRYLPNGQPDPSFNPYYPNLIPRIQHLAIQPDGKIIYSHYFLDDQFYSSFDLFRLNEDGSLDETFDYDPFWRGFLYDLEIQPDGKILLAGDFQDKEDVPNSEYLIRVNTDGTFDNFPNSLDTPVRQVDVQSNDSVLFKRYVQGSLYTDLQRLKADGTIDENFPIYSNINAFKVLRDDKILLSKLDRTLIKLLPTGSLDPDFQAENRGDVYGFEIDSNDNILAGENLLTSDGSYIRSLRIAFGGSVQISPNDELFARGDMIIQGRRVGIVKLHYNYSPTNRKAFDFDGDGKADIAVFRPSNGVWYIYQSKTNTYNIVQFGISEDKPVPADYDGDRIADITVYRPSSGVWYILRSSDGQVQIIRFGLAEDIPTQSDYDGDGKDDISLYRPSTGVWYRLNSADDSFFAQQFGGADGDRPVAADYDGDAIADLAFWRTSTGMWNYYSSIYNSTIEMPYNFFETDFATPADYDGDGITDIALWKSHNSGWYVLQSNMGSGIFAQLGAQGDIPVPADYDGDSKDDYAIWRPTTGEWLIRQTSDRSTFGFGFGLTGDIPIQSAFVR